MLKTPYLTSFRNSSHIQFNNDLIVILRDRDPDILQIRQKFDEFLAGTVKMEEVYKLMQGSPVTVKIIAEDDFRDNLIIGIEKLADAYTHHFDPAYVDAAHLILRHINKYGKTIARLKYQEETTALNDLIDSEKNDTALNAAVNLLVLNSWFVQLEGSNNRFKGLFIERLKDNAGKTDLKLNVLRKESVVHYKTLVKHLESHAIVNPSELYHVVIKEINRLVEKYNNSYHTRKSKGDDESEE